MNFKKKIAIFLVAAALTLVGFNAVASPYVDIMKVGRRAGNQIIADVLAKEAAARSVAM